MSVRFSITVSLDGYLAGPGPSPDEPLGKGGMQLHEWAFGLAAWRRQHGLEGGEVNASTAVVERHLANVGAYLMGRRMFGGGEGEWGDPPWNGWWGDDPPFRVPVVVVTHHARRPVRFENGTSYEFVDGFDTGLARAEELAAGKDVIVSGGASIVQQALAAGVVDEFGVSVAPVLLGGGTRLLDGVPAAALELLEAVEAPGVAHLRYRVKR